MPNPDPRDPARDELMIEGQEEVFSRTEVERGVIEHHALEEDRTFKESGKGPTDEDESLLGAKGDPAEGKP